MTSADSSGAILYVNGVRHLLPDGLAHLTLLEYLRDRRLTGAKLGCGEGGCGACTVMVSYFDQNLSKFVHHAINACLAPLYSLEGMHIITVEGVGSRRNGLHPIQESLVQTHGSQCGFCTPGFIMSMYALLRSNESLPTDDEIEECLAGNLCRCTGYRSIVDAFRVFAKMNNSAHVDGSITSCGESDLVCPATGMLCSCSSKISCGDSLQKSVKFAHKVELRSYNSTDGSLYTEKEFIFPPELLLRKVNYLNMNGFGGIKWYRPLKLQNLLELKEKFPHSTLVAGSTEVGIEMKFKRIQHHTLISVMHVPELNILNLKDHGVEIGAAVRLSELIKVLRKAVEVRPSHEVSTCKALIEQLKWFAGMQIRNVASVGGNICTASPISDLNPLWMAGRAKFMIIDTKGSRRETSARNFFLGYRKVDLANHEILLSIFLPWSRQYELIKEFKNSHRRDDDIAIVNAGMRVHLQKNESFWTVLDASIVYGGVAPLPLSAVKTQSFFIGKNWNHVLLSGALKVLEHDVILKEDAPGGMVEFRSSLILSFFFKFFLWVSSLIDGRESIPASHLSSVQKFQKPLTVGTQDYEIITRGTAVGSPAVHISSRLQVTGEAEYVGDIPMPMDGIHAALVLSTKPHARMISIDVSTAKNSTGFIGIFLSNDVPGSNNVGPTVADEELFASEFVTSVGQIIGVVVADTHENAKEAARKVIIHYQELPAVLSIREAIDSESFHPNSEKNLNNGDVHLCFVSGQCDRIVQGEVQVGGQEHFYLEPHCSLVWTVDGGNEVHMLSSTQAPQKHQKYVASVLGLPMSKVVCKTKRIGGGFGGKETRSALFAAAASVASYLLNRPVKITLDRDIDMITSGQRHSFFGNYKVGYTEEGKILALDLEIYSNGGNSADLSISVLERAMFHSDNVYEIPNVRITGRVCFTNLPSNTAFRGFGAPQGMLIAENWIQRIAMDLKTTPEHIREMNLQSEGSVLHYGQTLEKCTLRRLWNELKSRCRLGEAREDARRFNAENRWRKRGIALIPTKFGISFTTKFMNQAGALVHVYTDGTILVTHGGVEMGQGLHTKVAQIAASAFDVPLTSVFLSETSTDKVPNASPTAASASSDMYGAAVLDACEQIKSRMLPIASKYPSLSSFPDVVKACYAERVDLSAHGFYITPDIGFDWTSGKGSPFRYFTYGAAFAQVEIDTLTGDFHTRAVDVHLDLGCSINPAIDVGQIEGAFVQGLGWMALEELKWGDPAHPWVQPGSLYTRGPGTYKIPSAGDVPLTFSVSLLKGAPNPKSVHSSKAVGEPPLFLASSVFFAIKDAITAARAEEGYTDWFPLDNPATPERIRMACPDRFTAPFAAHDFRPKLSV